MKDKRFEYNNYYKLIIDTLKNEEYSGGEASEIMNELYEENCKLKRENHMWKSKYTSQVEELAVCYEKLGW